MDGSKEFMESVKNSWYFWKHDLKTKGVFITRENINDLICSRGFDPEVGILSIDIDGNDYWIWESITTVIPAIVIVEVNPIFGSEAAIATPYKADFNRTVAHYSNLYGGMSLNAAAYLAHKKGYKLVCMDSMGHNAFFVRNDLMGNLKEVSVRDAYRPLSFRESRGEDGRLTYLEPDQGLELIKDCPVVDVIDGRMYTVGDKCK